MRTDRGTVRATISSAGHPAPIIVRREGGVELPRCREPSLASWRSPRLEEATIELEIGDTLVFVTDGVEEARDADGSFFGRERLQQGIRRSVLSGRPVTAASLVAAIHTEVDDFCGSRPLRDDVVILTAIRCTPAKAPFAGAASDRRPTHALDVEEPADPLAELR